MFCSGRRVLICEQLLTNASWKWPNIPNRVYCKDNQLLLHQVHVGEGKGISKIQDPGNHQHTEKFQTLGNSYLVNCTKQFSYINTRKFLPLHLNTKKFLMEYITMSKQDIAPRGTRVS